MNLLTRYISDFLIKDRSGTALIEAAIIIPFMFLCLFGLVEVTSVLSAKERMNKISNQVAIVVSALPKWELRDEVTSVLTATEKVGGIHGFNISIVFCGATTGQKAVYTHSYKSGQCGYGTGGEGGAQAAASCSSVGTNVGRGQFMVVDVSCSYNPLFSFLDLLSDGGRINAEAFAPMRYVMNW